MANKYYSSDGKEWTQASINKEWTRTKHGLMVKYVCECCKNNPTQDPDHTISRVRCKELHKVELIFLEGGFSWSCRTCHLEWESYKDGKFSHHKNAYQRMLFVGMYDKEGFVKRYFCITNNELKDKLKSLYEELINDALTEPTKWKYT